MSKHNPASPTTVEVPFRTAKRPASEPSVAVPVSHPQKHPDSLAATHSLAKATIATGKYQATQQHAKTPSQDVHAHQAPKHPASAASLPTASPPTVKEPSPLATNSEDARPKHTKAVPASPTPTHQASAPQPVTARPQIVKALPWVQEVQSESARLDHSRDAHVSSRLRTMTPSRRRLSPANKTAQPCSARKSTTYQTASARPTRPTISSIKGTVHPASWTGSASLRTITASSRLLSRQPKSGLKMRIALRRAMS